MEEETIPEMKKFHDFLDMALDHSEYTNGFIVIGPGGISKSYRVETELKRKQVPFVKYNSHATSLGLYEIMYKNRDSVIVLDDVDAIFEDRKAVAVLKAASFSAIGERIVTWVSTSRILKEKGLPDRFEFKGKLIIMTNEMNMPKTKSFKAFLNRFYVHSIKMNEDSRKILIRSVLMKNDMFGLSEEQKKHLIGYMEGILDYSNVDEYNLRTAMKACEIYKIKGEEGKDMIAELLGTNDEMRKFLLVEDKAKHLTAKKRKEIWMEFTGRSASTYYDLKRQYYYDKYDNMSRLEQELNDLKELVGDASVQSNL